MALFFASISFAQRGIVRPPTIIPGGWETRKVGTVLNATPHVTPSGTARTIHLDKRREPVVELASNKGRTIRTSRGKNFVLGGVNYQPMGYKHGGNYFVLYVPAHKKFYYFKTVK